MNPYFGELKTQLLFLICVELKSKPGTSHTLGFAVPEGYQFPILSY